MKSNGDKPLISLYYINIKSLIQAMRFKQLISSQREGSHSRVGDRHAVLEVRVKLAKTPLHVRSEPPEMFLPALNGIKSVVS